MLHCVWTFCSVGIMVSVTLWPGLKLTGIMCLFLSQSRHDIHYKIWESTQTLQKYICIYMHASMHTFIQKIKSMELHPRKRGEKGKRKIRNFSGTSPTTSVLTLLPSKTMIYAKHNQTTLHYIKKGCLNKKGRTSTLLLNWGGNKIGKKSKDARQSKLQFNKRQTLKRNKFNYYLQEQQQTNSTKIAAHFPWVVCCSLHASYHWVVAGHQTGEWPLEICEKEGA